MPLCTKHHNEWHTSGPGFMIRKFPRVKGWLEHWGREDVLDRARKSLKP